MTSLTRLSKKQNLILGAYQTRVSPTSDYKAARKIMYTGGHRVPFLQVIAKDMAYIRDLPLKDNDDRYCLDTLESITKVVLTVFRGSANFKGKVLGERYIGELAERSEKLYSIHRPSLMGILEKYGWEDWTYSVQDAIKIHLDN